MATVKSVLDQPIMVGPNNFSGFSWFTILEVFSIKLTTLYPGSQFLLVDNIDGNSILVRCSQSKSYLLSSFGEPNPERDPNRVQYHQPKEGKVSSNEKTQRQMIAS